MIMTDDRGGEDRGGDDRGGEDTSTSAAGGFDFDTPVDRRGTASYKWDKYEGRDIIPLWVADMDFPSPPAVIAALHERVAHGVFGYTYASAGLEAAVRRSLFSDYGWEVAREWIVWLPGLVSGLNVLCRAVGVRGDQVATYTPIYPPFMSAPALAGRTAVRVPLVLDAGRWEMDLEALERSLTARSRLLLLCSPHNPVGRVWSETELCALAEVACRHDLVIGSDEIHAGLVLDEDKSHLPVATLSSETAARTVTLMAPSKTFNMPGLGCSFAIISDPALRAAFAGAMEGIVPHVNALGYVAAQAAYEEGADWRRALLAYLRVNRDLVEREISTMPGLAVAHVEATYLAWIDARAAGLPDPAAFFEEAGVGLSDGSEFGAPGFVRLNFGCSRSLLTKALTRMRTALSR
ncbi:MAG: PatB family C-S lyase [Actinomycetia bacterium]|nr:PatB family C-S lyase [Actinomycetes bacterium]